MKQILMMLLLLNFPTHSSFWTHPNTSLGAISLSCVLFFSKQVLCIAKHKKSMIEVFEARYGHLFKDMKEQLNVYDPCYFPRTESDLKKRGWCNNEINLVYEYIAELHNIPIKSACTIQYDIRDARTFAQHCYKKKLRIPFTGMLIGTFGLGVCVYNLCINNYKL